MKVIDTYQKLLASILPMRWQRLAKAMAKNGKVKANLSFLRPNYVSSNRASRHRYTSRFHL